MATCFSDTDKLEEETITEVLPHTRNIDDGWDLKLRELSCRSDTRKQKNLWRIEGPSRQDYFLVHKD